MVVSRTGAAGRSAVAPVPTVSGHEEPRHDLTSAGNPGGSRSRSLAARRQRRRRRTTTMPPRSRRECTGRSWTRPAALASSAATWRSSDSRSGTARSLRSAGSSARWRTALATCSGRSDEELTLPVSNVDSTCNQLRMDLAATDAEVLGTRVHFDARDGRVRLATRARRRKRCAFCARWARRFVKPAPPRLRPWRSTRSRRR